MADEEGPRRLPLGVMALIISYKPSSFDKYKEVLKTKLDLLTTVSLRDQVVAANGEDFDGRDSFPPAKTTARDLKKEIHGLWSMLSFWMDEPRLAPQDHLTMLQVLFLIDNQVIPSLFRSPVVLIRTIRIDRDHTARGSEAICEGCFRKSVDKSSPALPGHFIKGYSATNASEEGSSPVYRDCSICSKTGEFDVASVQFQDM